MSGGALDGVRVVEIGGGIAASFAARLLGDFGADVVKVEPPAGDPVRHEGPQLATVGHSVLFELANWNTRSVLADLGEAAGCGWVEQLVAAADIAIVGLEPAAQHALELDAPALVGRHPHLVATSVTSFGLTGPDADVRATDLVLQAMSGTMAISGASDREPIKHGMRTSLWAAGLNAAYASVAALLAAERTGHGVALDLSVQEVLASELVINHAYYVFSGAVQSRPPAAADPLDGNPLPTADGYLALQTSARQPLEALSGVFADPRLADPRWATAEGRVEHAAELAQILGERLDTETARDLFVRLSADGVLSGVTQGPGALLDCPQLTARQAFIELGEHAPQGSPWRLPARLVNLSRTPTSVRRPAPRLGEHDEEVRAERARLRSRPAPQASDERPLAGLRVLDLSIIFAVPYMGALLADLGAEVIKVEAPGRIDQTRTDWGGYFDNDPGDDPWNRSGTFQNVNRGKRSLALDLTSAAGQRVLRGLLAQTDLLIDNFTPRVLPRWGLDYPSLRTEFPRLIALSNTGYGSTGLWAGFKSQGTTLEATMGLMAVTGYPDGPPARAGQSAPDFFACWTGLLALLAALYERERSGLGQWIDLGMYQLGAAVIPEALIARQATGRDPERNGAGDLGAALSGVFEAADGGWVAVSAAHGDSLDVLGGAGAAAWIAEREAAAAVAQLRDAGLAAGPVRDAAEVFADPQMRSRGFLESVPVDGLAEPVPLIGRPYRWESLGSSVGLTSGAPRFGEANAEILCERLGLSADEIAELYARGVVVDAPVGAPPGRPLDLELMLQTGVLTRVDPKPEAVA